jgi:predicted outer membrane repeat protein
MFAFLRCRAKALQSPPYQNEVHRPRLGSGFELLEDRVVPAGGGALPAYIVNVPDDTAYDHYGLNVHTGKMEPLDANGNTSLRAVVTYANQNPLSGPWNTSHYDVDLSPIAGQTITFDAQFFPQTLALNTNFNFLATAGNVTVQPSAGATFRLFSLSANTESHFTGMILQNGYALGSGGAVSVAGVAQFEGCTFAGNQARGMTGHGGAIAVTAGGSLTVSNCTFTDNRADANGGAIAALQFSLGINIINCTFNGNNRSVNANGGAVSMIGFIPDPNNPDPNNPDPVGLLSISGTTITGSTAFGKGGGIYVQTVWGVTIDQTTIRNNGADLGGGLYVQDSFVSVTGGSLDTNVGSSGGGVFYIDADDYTVTLDQVSVTNNSATNGKGGGGYLLKGTLTGSVSALTGNTSGAAGFAGIAWKTGSTANVTVPPNQQALVNDP